MKSLLGSELMFWVRFGPVLVSPLSNLLRHMECRVSRRLVSSSTFNKAKCWTKILEMKKGLRRNGERKMVVKKSKFD